MVPHDVAKAEQDGLLSIIDRLRPGYAERVKQWRLNLNERFEERAKHASPDEVRMWYLDQLCRPKLPDLRAERTFDQDLGLVVYYALLYRILSPIFREHGDPATRKAHVAARIARLKNVDAEVRHRARPANLPLLGPASAYCYHLLETNPVQLSRARRRVTRVLRNNLPQSLHALQELALSPSSSTNSRIIRQAQSAATFLAKTLRPLSRRSK